MDFSLWHHSFGAHPASCGLDFGGPSPKVKQTAHEADHVPEV